MDSLHKKLFPDGRNSFQIQDLEKAILTLPKQNREALYMHYWEKLPRRIIAVKLGWSLSKVSQKITRGITLLKLELNPNYFKSVDELIKQTAHRLLLR